MDDSTMVLEVEFCGDRQVMQVPKDCTLADFRQFVNVYTGVPVADQDLSLPPESTDATVISTIAAEGDLITLKIRGSGGAASHVDPSTPEAPTTPGTRAAIERALAEDGGAPAGVVPAGPAGGVQLPMVGGDG
eukprot:Hpha_TRINITY_DN32517_c0_g1::TRINITY_DN32517_c0_g1_i1::g.24449::m.24449